MQKVAYYIENCKVCNQGRVEVVKDKQTQTIYFCCDECEAEWSNAEDAIENNNGSRGKFGQIEYPSKEEIISLDLMKYVKNPLI